jgi:2-polyprenyl-3-methyl-5-hydroxy-6-metoxy-1,4-benzoquinol methylase
MKSDFVFKEVSGNLVYVGDFEGLYQSEADPWGQSATAGVPMDLFYRHSRERLASIIELVAPTQKLEILEVGCGHGHSTQDLADRLSMANVIGMDVSHTAITEAKRRYPNLDFMHGDIREQSSTNSTKYDVVVLHQMLWYVLNDLPLVLQEARSLLRAKDDSVCLVSQAFPREQRYGKNVFDGYEGAVKYFKSIPGVHLVHSAYSDFANLPHIDCHFALKFQ